MIAETVSLGILGLPKAVAGIGFVPYVRIFFLRVGLESVQNIPSCHGIGLLQEQTRERLHSRNRALLEQKQHHPLLHLKSHTSADVPYLNTGKPSNRQAHEHEPARLL